jgi:hypothetical protein
VAKPLLERAFRETYDLDLEDVFASVDLAFGSYRWAVSQLIPEATKVAWNLKKDDLIQASPGLVRRNFVYNLSRAAYEKDWGREYERPGIGARILALLFRLIPKIGPFRALKFKPPTPETAKLFMESFNRTLDMYRGLLGQEAAKRLNLENRDLDTGEATAPGEYELADRAYARLARKLADQDAQVDPQLRDNIVEFFRDPNPPAALRHEQKEWRRTLDALRKLHVRIASR